MMEAIQSFDAGVLFYLQDFLRSPFWNTFFVLFSRLGDGGILWIALGLALLFPPKTRRQGFDILLCIAFAALVTNGILKPLFERVRPYNALEGLSILVPPEPSWSFPSGHANASFAAAFALTKCFGKKGAWSYLIAALISFSRLWVGVHYPTDVLGGIVCGTLLAYLAWVVSHRLIRSSFLAPHEDSGQ
ncbi:MAG: phosphatase PAP2 family protein [Oscillospiraceae bacterium]|jgi:membrane-associated phospholipid phosphatase